MKNNSSLDPDSSTSLAAIVGLDWGGTEHAFCLCPAEGEPEAGSVAAQATQFHPWMLSLEQRFGGRPVAFALEGQPRGLVAALSDYPWAIIYPLHPATSARFRKAFTPSGAKDDPPDARDLAALLTQHRAYLRPMPEPAAQEIRQLDQLVRLRRQLVDQRVAACLQLRAALLDYFPQALAMFSGDLWKPIVGAFLKRWSDLPSLLRARPATLRRFFYEHGVRRPQTIEQRLASLAQARLLHRDHVLAHSSQLRVRLRWEQIQLLNRQIGQLDQTIAKLARSQDNWSLIKSLPGAGPALGPRLLCALAQAPELNAVALQKYSGVAPVRQKSGSRCWTHRRWNAPQFLHQSLVEWAGLSVQYSVWAKAYYDQAQAAGKGRYTILRALAFKWLRILVSCWNQQQPYDEQRYLAQLSKRNSPLASLLPAAS